MAIKPKNSASGFYKVDLSRPFPFQGFNYLPSHQHTVNEEIFEAMQAEDGLLVAAQPA